MSTSTSHYSRCFYSLFWIREEAAFGFPIIAWVLARNRKLIYVYTIHIYSLVHSVS